jgi:hypothetical protein
MKKDFPYYLSLQSFCSDLAESITFSNIDFLINAMESESYNSLPKNEKESEAFRSVYQSFFLFDRNNELLHYLIFDYKISEANSIDKIKVSDTVKAMFEARNLSSELSTELEDGNKPNKKVKL